MLELARTPLSRLASALRGARSIGSRGENDI